MVFQRIYHPIQNKRVFLPFVLNEKRDVLAWIFVITYSNSSYWSFYTRIKLFLGIVRICFCVFMFSSYLFFMCLSFPPYLFFSYGLKSHSKFIVLGIVTPHLNLIWHVSVMYVCRIIANSCCFLHFNTPSIPK